MRRRPFFHSAALLFVTFLWVDQPLYLGINQEPNEYLTKNEVEKIRQAQQIDERVKVLMKVAERRLLLLENPSATISKKEEEQWGPLPIGSSAELLSQYVKAIDETIINIEDAYGQDPGDEFLYKALKTFREATDTHLNKLKALRATVKAETDLGELDRAIEAAELANEDAKKGEARFEKMLEDEKAKKKKPEKKPESPRLEPVWVEPASSQAQACSTTNPLQTDARCVE